MGYGFKSRIRYSEVDEEKRLTLPKIVDYFQDCSTFQSEDLQVGLEELYARRRAWILAYWKIEVIRYPLLGEEILTETWPNSFQGFFGGRNFRMTDADGGLLARADSLWIYLDIDTGHPARVDAKVRGAYTLEEPLPMGKLMRKIPVPPGGEARSPFPVMKSDLDTNHHVNNGQYIRMAQEYLPEGFAVQKVRVEYRRSALLQDVITPIVCEEQGRVTVSLTAADQKPYAVMEFSGTARTFEAT